jgi:antitoxin ParD1/3/4
MPTMNVSLPAEFVAFVEAEVAAGDYGTASEVVRDALRLLRREKAGREEKLAVLRREVGTGLTQANEGGLSHETVADILAELEAEDPRS